MASAAPAMPISVSDYRELTRRRLPSELFDYVDGGSYEERTLHENIASFGRVKLRSRVLRDVSKIDTSISLFDRDLTIPVALAPLGFGGMLARRGEVQAARAAENFGIPYTLSTLSICPIEEVRAGTTQPFWFQLYVVKDRGYSRELLQRAQAAGCPVLVFTVDLPVLGTRYRDVRHGVGPLARLRSLPHLMRRWSWAYDVGLRGRPLKFGNLSAAVPKAKGFADFGAWIASNLDPSMTWKDLEWVRANWSGKILIKGVMDPQDASLAMSSIAPDGIIVSNHGGRQLDSAPSSLSALPAIREIVGDRTKLLLDGGIRTGLDVVKALASGADACLLGRAYAYALAAQGQSGVEAMLETFRREIYATLAFTGAISARSVSRDILA